MIFMMPQPQAQPQPQPQAQPQPQPQIIQYKIIKFQINNC